MDSHTQRPPSPRKDFVATNLHSDLTGSGPHPNKIDGTTGTELTAAAETIYDARWVNRTASSITVPTRPWMSARRPNERHS